MSDEPKWVAPNFTPEPWEWTFFCKPDGEPYETVQDVADALAYSAFKSDRTELWGVSGIDPETGESVVVCYTGNGPRSAENACMIGASPMMYAYIAARAKDGDEEAEQIVRSIAVKVGDA